MYDKPMLGLGQAQDAIAAILTEANKEPDRPWPSPSLMTRAA